MELLLVQWKTGIMISSCQMLDCSEVISVQLIMCPKHWEMVPTIFQRPLLSQYDPGIRLFYQNIVFQTNMRRARISILCQEKSTVNLAILPDYDSLSEAKKLALMDIIRRYQHADSSI